MLTLQKFHIRNFLCKKVHIAPLITFRMIFGLVMLISTIRFVLNGWIYDLYLKPDFFFSYYGFEWIQPLGYWGMYMLFFLMGISSLFIFLGYLYRVSISAFFLCFTYVELIDKTPYLNHYYLVSIIAFLLILVPANRYFSLDTVRKPAIKKETIPLWQILIFRFQLGLVYFYAGMAKINYEWLIKAKPLSIWLKSKVHLPVIGYLFNFKWSYYLFSWFGALYDLTLPLFLSLKKTRKIAYLFVIIFHMMTWYLFPKIGMFPFIMIGFTLIFFPVSFHKKILFKTEIIIKKLNFDLSIIKKKDSLPGYSKNDQVLSAKFKYLIPGILILHFVFQIFFPLRYTVYPGNLFWTEQGYRFSWRVMLIEKTGVTTFYVEDAKTGVKKEVINSNYLTPYQEKMMSTQPDMILQFAHYLEKKYKKRGFNDPKIYVRSYVNLNGKGSKKFIDPGVDLSNQHRGFAHKDWIIPFNSKKSERLTIAP